MSAVAQPSGTVTLVFTDIEGSTRLLDDLGQDGYRDALAMHRGVIREAFGRHSRFKAEAEFSETIVVDGVMSRLLGLPSRA